MCGLLGWSLNRNPGRKLRRALRRTFAELSWYMRYRGEDSWGIIADGEIHRGSGPMPDALDDVPRELLGHTRFATTGRKELSHPFSVGDLHLMHNGQVYNHAELNRRHSRSCEIDSEHIALHIAENRDLSELQGYGAIQCLDAGEHYIGGEPIVVAETRVGLFWSSTEEVFDALECARIRPIDQVRLDSSKLYLVTGGELWDSGRRFAMSDPPIRRETEIRCTWPPDEWEGYGRSYSYGE